MAKHLSLGLVEDMISECPGDILILLIDHDTTSIVSLTSMLAKFSYKVMTMNVASEALSFIEEHNDIGLIIANIEMPHMDPQSFLTSLLHKDIPLMLISPENKTEQESDLLMKKGCFCLKKPYSEEDIKNVLQQVLHKKSPKSEKINILGTEENVADDQKSQTQAFKNSLKRQSTSQGALLGRSPISENLKTSETCYKRRISPNAEWNDKLVAKEKPKFYLGGVFDLENQPFLNESSKDIDCVSSAASNNPTYNMDDNNQSGNNFHSLSNRDRSQMGYIGQSSSTLETNRNHRDLGSTSTLDANMAHMDWVPSIESYNPSHNMMSSVTQQGFVHREANHAVMNTVIPPGTTRSPFQTNRNQMGTGYFGGSYVLPRNILYHEFRLTHMRLVTHQIGYRFSYETNRTILETNVNQMDWVSLQERFVHVLSPVNVTFAGTNTTQVGLVPAEATQATPDNVIVPDTNMEDASLIPYNTDHDVSVENLISFDKNINEMDLQSCLGNLSHGSASNHPTEAQDHSSAMELGSTSQQLTNIEDDRELMDWINELLKDDA